MTVTVCAMAAAEWALTVRRVRVHLRLPLSDLAGPGAKFIYNCTITDTRIAGRPAATNLDTRTLMHATGRLPSRLRLRLSGDSTAAAGPAPGPADLPLAVTTPQCHHQQPELERAQLTVTVTLTRRAGAQCHAPWPSLVTWASI